MKALIQGAGISGLACARVLDERGWDVTIVEAATAPRTGGYMIDFFGPGWEAAARLGVIDEIRRRGHDYRRLVTRDASGRVTARIGLDLVRAAARGRFTSILREDVELSLRAGLPARIDQRFGVSVAELTRRRSGVEATLTDGTGIEADLVLGCDGLSSGLRSLLFGPANEFVLDLGYRVGGGHFHAPGIGGRLGGDVFLSDVKGEQFGMYAVDDDWVAGFAVERSARGLPEDPAAWIAGIARRNGPLASAVAEAEVETPYIDRVAQSVVPRWRLGGTLLMGDAAHAVSLLAGQGASLAIAGAVALGDALDSATGLDDGLAAYESTWRGKVEQVQRSARRSASTFIPSSELGLRLRRLGLRAAGLPIVSKFVGRLSGGAPTHSGTTKVPA
ncbi:FAD-dependent monooxygenase [Tessaracoccus flavescens]|uniref:FAD-binding domain-containing protein n=1 Tax=Tessaracoccus flavescens TaxID=399497 RepID=A0A1Q2CYA7_9ACTN|nr:FAD-dependent monooxygenase [Tessaracoccus flavescens]AQP51070.1 hypothetical protein BW733_09765 [Tessaracoccus flavescens]